MNAAGRLSLSLFLFLALTLPSSEGFSAPSDFYSMSGRWDRRNALGEPIKDVLEKSFEEILKAEPVSPTGIPIPPPKKLTLTEITGGLKDAEIELNQSLIASGASVTKFVAAEEGIVTLESLTPDSLKITAIAVGRTFVHVWDATGRNTFEVKVTPPRYVPPPDLKRRREAVEGSRSFRADYSLTHSGFYQGDKFREINRTSETTNQNIALDGDTPYGHFVSRALAQRSGDKTIVTDMQAALENGKIGPYGDFNLRLIDASVRPGLLAFPEGRVRGADIEYWNDRARWEVFYGREQTSIIGSITPGVITKRTRDSFLGGAVADFKLNEGARMKAGYFGAFGRSRRDELNRRAYGALWDLTLGPRVKFKPEVDFNEERFAHRHVVEVDLEKLRMRHEVRDIPKKFETMLGSPSAKGELGYKAEAQFRPSDKLEVDAKLDAFRDRLVLNPERRGHWNFHKDLRVSFFPFERTNLIFTHQDSDDTGRIGPAKQRTTGVQLNRQLEFFGRRWGFFSRYQNRGNRNLNNATLDYVRNQVASGFQTTLFRDVNFSFEHEYSVLEEPNIRSITHPMALTYLLDTRRQLGNTPFYVEARLRYRDEEEAESVSSFMKGEDALEISGGLYYRGFEGMEVYLTGSFENFNPESRNVTTPRVEAQFFTGVRYLYDSGWRWEAVGSFEGSVFKDLNADGVRTPDEPGIEGVVIRTDRGQEAKTDAQGFYEFKSVRGQIVVLTLDSRNIPYGYAPTSPLRQEIPILDRRTQEVHFGITPRSELTGVIFSDLDGNGRYDLGEKGIRKVRILLEDGRWALTNALGVYVFSSVAAGDHTARLDIPSLPEGYIPVEAPTKSFTIFEGIRYELNFPLRAQRAVTGRVWLDENDNGALDPDEKGVEGVKVSLGDQTVFTDREGWYLFDDLPSGEFRLAADPSTVPPGLAAPAGEVLKISSEPVTLSNKNLALRKTKQ